MATKAACVTVGGGCGDSSGIATDANILVNIAVVVVSIHTSATDTGHLTAIEIPLPL